MNARPGCAALLVLAAALSLPGCRLHVGRVDVNRSLSRDAFASIALGEYRRRDVLALLGPPDEAFYTPTELVFDYWAGSHRSTDLRFFLPTDLLPGPNPPSLLAFHRFFFDLFVESPVFLPTLPERVARASLQAASGLVPFTSGEELLILHGRQLRVDRLRVVFERDGLEATRKSLRLATGEYRQESLAQRILLQTN